MAETVSESSIVGQNEEALGLDIETTHMEKTGKFRGQEIKDCIARVWIMPGGSESGRFMQHDVERPLRLHELAIDLDVVARCWLNVEIRASPAVNGDATGGDQFIAMPTRADAGRGEKAIKAQ